MLKSALARLGRKKTFANNGPRLQPAAEYNRAYRRALIPGRLPEMAGSILIPAVVGGVAAVSVPAHLLLLIPPGIAVFAVALTSGYMAAARREARLSVERTYHELCKQCGYDCRATPGRCHECGEMRAPPLDQTP